MLAKDVKKIERGCKEQLVKKYDGLVKAIWIYGSAVRAAETPHDIDMMVIVDDTRGDVPDRVIASLRHDIDVLEERLKKEKLNTHWQPPKPLSLWWDMLRSGNPLAFTAMRDALVIYDPAGYIAPLQILLKAGKVAGTREQAEELIGRAPIKLEQARKIFLNEITSDLMTSMTECAHAVLMFAGIYPSAERNVHTELRERFVKHGLLEGKYVDDYESFFELSKKIQHGEITRLSGEEIDRWLKKVIGFIDRMEKLFVVLDAVKRKSIIEGAHRTAFTACQAALRKVGERPPEKYEKIIENFKRHFIDTGLVAAEHLDVLQRIHAAKKAIEAGKAKELSEKEIYESEVYAKNLAAILERAAKKHKLEAKG